MHPSGDGHDPTSESPVRRLETLLASLLRTGVGLSLAILLSGIAVTLLRHPDYLTDPATLARLTKPGAAFPHTLPDVVRELTLGRGRAIMTVGLLVLIITPVLRVAASAVVFALGRDRSFTVITSLVLIILIVSFALGRAQ